MISATINGCGFCISLLAKELTNFTDQLMTAFQLFGDNVRIEMFQVQLQEFLVSSDILFHVLIPVILTGICG